MRRWLTIALLLALCCCRAVGGGMCCERMSYCGGLIPGCLCDVGLACEVSAP